MSTITWIVIVLIVISIAVTVTEVGLRFGMLEKGRGERAGVTRAGISGGVRSVVRWGKGVEEGRETKMDLGKRNFSRGDFNARQLQSICGADILGEKIGEL